jgi:hypothetical protein
MNRNRLWTVGLSLIAGALITAAGCTPKPAGSAKEDKPVPSHSDKQVHEHQGGGSHQGVLVEWGKDEYHAEFVVDHSEQEATVYVLDGEAKKAPSIKPDKISDMVLNISNLVPPLSVELKYDAKRSNNNGIVFTATHKQLGIIKEYKGSISAMINGKPYAGDFEDKAHGGKEAHTGMPAGVVGDREKKLYLEPGGLYTEEDIKANGTTVPSERFKDAVWAHDEDLKTGDKVCPVTANKAEAECSWIVGGKKYEFCCPPCLDKFMMWAKTKPEKVKDPGDYVKK